MEIQKEEQITKIREKINDLEVVENIREELDELKELRRISYDNYISLAKLYFKCLNLFKEICKEKEINIEINLNEGFEDFEIELEKYNSNNFGKYYAGEKIKDYVIKNKKDINTFIDFFFKLIKE